MLDFRIETFLSVCRHMSFTAASEELHITQPAVSQHIRFLEKTYGCPLFLRDGKRIALTPAGKVLLRTMGSLLNDEKALVRRMQEAGSQGKTMVFGATRTIGEYAILPALSQYLKQHPDVNVQVRYGNTQMLVDLLHAGEIDFALVEGYVSLDDFDVLVDRVEPYLPVCAKGHVFQKPVSSLRDLLGERLLIREKGSGTREILEKYLSQSECVRLLPLCPGGEHAQHCGAAAPGLRHRLRLSGRCTRSIERGESEGNSHLRFSDAPRVHLYLEQKQLFRPGIPGDLSATSQQLSTSP